MSEPQGFTQSVKKRVVVIVDDRHDYKEDLAKFLDGFDVRFWGCRPACRECGGVDHPFADATAYIRQIAHEPDSRVVAILLDVSEFEIRADDTALNVILPQLKSDPALQHIPVIVYSAAHRSNLAGKARAAGAVYYYDMALTSLKKAAEKVKQYALP